LVVSEVHQQSNYGYPSQSQSMEEAYSPDCVVASDTLLHQFTKVGIRIMYKKLEIKSHLRCETVSLVSNSDCLPNNTVSHSRRLDL